MASGASTPSSSQFPLRNFKRDSQTAQLGEKTFKYLSLATDLAVDPPQSLAKRAQLTPSFPHTTLERQLMELKEENGGLERQLKAKIIEVERLQQDRRWLADRETVEREEKEQEASKWQKERSQSAKDMGSLRAALAVLMETQTKLEETNRNLSHSEMQKKNELNSLLLRLNYLETELQAANALIGERDREFSELKDQLSAQEPSRLGDKENSREDEAVIQAELHRQTTYLMDLERTNTRLAGELTRLRERNGSVAVLQEEKRGLESKLVGMEGLRARVAELELKLQSRSSLSTSTSENDAAAAHALAALRLTHAQLLSHHGATLEQLATTKADLEAAQAQIAEEHSAFDALEAEKDDLELQLIAAEGKLQASDGEAKFLQALVASYREESQVNHDAPGTISAPGPAHLEALLGEYQAMKDHEARDRATRDASTLQAQELQLKETETALQQERQKVQEREERAKALADEQTTHLAQIDALEQELFELRGEIAGGRHVPPGVRILQLKDNPESQWAEMRQAALDHLKRENLGLMNRLRELGALSGPGSGSATDAGPQPGPSGDGDDGAKGEGGGGTADLVPRASWELVNREKIELEEVVRQKEKRLLRLKEVYNAKGVEFRDAIASILGVKLSFRPNGEVRATSIYDLGASFAFQPARGTMQLVAQGEGGPQDLPNLMRFWIASKQCIPGFMASVTLECYENAKRGEGAPAT
ncbi:hypothetical protein C0991_005224 [Blastosporella zonata]|nr:hypothetical protein C0991_005224 [Blastosporella zonata]